LSDDANHWVIKQLVAGNTWYANVV